MQTLATLYHLSESNIITEHGEKTYKLHIKDLPEEEKPREKLIKYGPSVLSSAELLAVLLNTGTKKEGVLEMTNRLLKEYGDKAIVDQRDPKKVQGALNIPLVKACQIVACFELGRRSFKTRTGGAVHLRTPKQVFEYVKDMRELSKEHLRGLYLDNHYRLIRDEVISIGSLTANITHPREVFRPALEYSASAMILVHNHPSGVVKPSESDIEITKQLVEAGKILGIHLLDHVIVTKKEYTSVPVKYDV